MNSKMLGYLFKRLILAIVTIYLVITITFFAMNEIPGGPFLSEKAITPQVQEQLEAKYNLDKPLFERYLTYLGDVVQFDFGPSIKLRGRNVSEIILEGFKTSAKIGLIAAIIAIINGTILGALAAVFHNRFADKLIMVTSTACVAIPSFIIATILLLMFCVKMNVFPVRGDTAMGLILPIISLSLYPTSYITRLTRSSMLDVLSQDYIRTAKAKGVSRKSILFKHALKNAVTPTITYAGPMIAYILTGSLVVEKIFSVPGLGGKFVSSINSRDYPLIMGTTIFLTTIVVIMLLLSDILYKVVNPRLDLE